MWEYADDDEYRRIAKVIAGLMHAPDHNIRNYAVDAVRLQYRDYGNIFRELLNLALNRDESLNTRYSALSVIAEAGPRQDSRQTLKKIAGQRHELAAEAKRILDDWEQSEHDREE